METAFPLQHYLSEKRISIERALRTYLPSQATSPTLLHESMRYSILAGGKRLRPLLVLMAAELCGKEPEDVLFAAAALEMIHTYSLIHDDLPSMDDDDLRRGQPTNHKKYGEAVAILAGDALLTLAFQVMSDVRYRAVCSTDALLQATHELSCAAGSTGMVGGQMLDLEGEKRRISPEELQTIHALKTGKLLSVALRIGAILSEAPPETSNALNRYGERIGLAFQIVDDILDLEGDEAELGKSPQSDVANRKSTYPALYGVAESKILASNLIEQAHSALDIFGERARYLRDLATYIVARTH